MKKKHIFHFYGLKTYYHVILQILIIHDYINFILF